MKCYNHFIPSDLPLCDPDAPKEVEIPAKNLGSAITDGRYNGVCDGAAGLLQGQYDNDSSMSVDPLCDLSTDVFGMRTGSSVQSEPPSDQNE